MTIYHDYPTRELTVGRLRHLLGKLEQHRPVRVAVPDGDEFFDDSFAVVGVEIGEKSWPSELRTVKNDYVTLLITPTEDDD